MAERRVGFFAPRAQQYWLVGRRLVYIPNNFIENAVWCVEEENF
jgi:hypothetical protein